MYDYVTHSGILGMRWGIRRYQNKDGSLTAEGKKRRREEKQSVSKDKPKMETEKKISNMTDDELRSKISRLELEKRYADMMKVMNPKKTSRIKKLITDIMYDSAKNAGTELVTKIMKNMVNSLMDASKKSGKTK